MTCDGVFPPALGTPPSLGKGVKITQWLRPKLPQLTTGSSNCNGRKRHPRPGTYSWGFPEVSAGPLCQQKVRGDEDRAAPINL